MIRGFVEEATGKLLLGVSERRCRASEISCKGFLNKNRRWKFRKLHNDNQEGDSAQGRTCHERGHLNMQQKVVRALEDLSHVLLQSRLNRDMLARFQRSLGLYIHSAEDFAAYVALQRLLFNEYPMRIPKHQGMLQEGM